MVWADVRERPSLSLPRTSLSAGVLFLPRCSQGEDELDCLASGLTEPVSFASGVVSALAMLSDRRGRRSLMSLFSWRPVNGGMAFPDETLI